MTNSADLRAAFRAGKTAVETRSHWPAFLGGGIGVTIGRIIWKSYSLPWFKGAPISILIVALLTLLFSTIEQRLRPAPHVDD